SDSEQEYFADGIVEDIITALSRFKTLFVIARNSSFTYKGKAVDTKQVGRELGVRFGVAGGDRLHPRPLHGYAPPARGVPDRVWRRHRARSRHFDRGGIGGPCGNEACSRIKTDL